MVIGTSSCPVGNQPDPAIALSASGSIRRMAERIPIIEVDQSRVPLRQLPSERNTFLSSSQTCIQWKS